MEKIFAVAITDNQLGSVTWEDSWSLTRRQLYIADRFREQTTQRLGFNCLNPAPVAELALYEACVQRVLFARIGKEGLEILSDDFARAVSAPAGGARTLPRGPSAGPSGGDFVKQGDYGTNYNRPLIPTVGPMPELRDLSHPPGTSH